MLDYVEPVTTLIDELKRLPGIGHKSAQRLAFYILRADREEAERLIEAINEVKEKIILCSTCNNIRDVAPCLFCSSPSRDKQMFLVVEDPFTLVTIEGFFD